MKANELERAVIERMLADCEPRPVRSVVNFEAVTVSDREFTGVGFMTELERSEELRLFDAGLSLRWGNVGARLNASRLETSYLVYVDDGYVTTVEGYTYGDEWPDEVERIELYELKPGMELITPLRADARSGSIASAASAATAPAMNPTCRHEGQGIKAFEP